MYDMYPEWGPAQHDDDHAAYAARPPAYSAGPPQSVQESMDLRDHGGERPDDN